MMMIGKIGRMSLSAAVGLLLLAGPIAFSHPHCDMGSCCCKPVEHIDLAFGSAPCCECSSMGADPSPIEPVVNFTFNRPETIVPQIVVEAPLRTDILAALDFASRLIEFNSLSPPFVESSINTPLIC